MKQITSFPYKLSFSYQTYECGSVFKVKGKHIQEIILNDGNFLRELNPKQRHNRGIQYYESKVKTGDHSFKVTNTIIIENENASPLKSVGSPNLLIQTRRVERNSMGASILPGFSLMILKEKSNGKH